MKYYFTEFFTQSQRCALCCLLLLTMAGCEDGGSDGPDIGDNNPDTYLCMGDSITRGDGLDSSQSYPSRLAGMTGKRFINSGHDGEFSWQGRDRLQRELDRYKPAYCLIMYGANDIIYGLSSRTIPELQAMIDICKANKTIPVVATLTPAAGRHSYMSGAIDILNERIRTLWKETGVRRADVSGAFGGNLSLLQSDGLHPTSEGASKLTVAFSAAVD